MFQGTDKPDVFDPERWGLPTEAVVDLADRLRRVWSRFRDCFKTKTRDTGEYAFVYLRGLLAMETNRNFANIARRVTDPDDDGQNLQQFMSDSPWSGQAVFDLIQAEICQRPEWQGGMLTLDESGDKCAGPQKAGAGRQYLGRLGKVDLGQVGVGLGYYKGDVWALVDGELYLPEIWFDDDHAQLRRRWHIPRPHLYDETGTGLAQDPARQANGLPFEVVGCDSLYGRDGQFRADLDAERVIHMADIPEDTQVYLEKPVVGIPETPPAKKGRPFSQFQVLNEVEPVEVRQLATHPDTVLQPIAVRHTERGLLTYECAARRVWTITERGQARQEWLFIRQESDNTFSSLSNASAETPLSQLALWRSQRYFAERIF